MLKRQLAIISSMTAFERRNPKVMNASRKKRVASGSGTKVEEINRLLKMHLQMADMMKKMGRNPGMFGRMFGGGPAVPDEAELQKLQSELAGMDPNAAAERDQRHDETDGGRRRPGDARSHERALRTARARGRAAQRPAGARRTAVPRFPP